MEVKVSIPPGWEYNPSANDQRHPIALLAFIGLCIAFYLGLFELHVIKHVWDPVFKGGSENVLESKLSKSFPIPDALLGASAYVLDIIFDLVGDTSRWKTKPWIVILFGLAAGPLGFTGILLVISQGVLVHDWCTLCLCSALISVVIISPASDEVLATLQYLKRVKNNNDSLWKAFWGNKEIANKLL
jgi:uncharacterized membrane protein